MSVSVHDIWIALTLFLFGGVFITAFTKEWNFLKAGSVLVVGFCLLLTFIWAK